MTNKSENTENGLKYSLMERLLDLPVRRFREAKEELPVITGYTWKTIYYQWTQIKLDAKRSIPSEPLDKVARWFNLPADALKNYLDK